MGSNTSKTSPSQAELHHLLQHTAYDEAEVLAWYKLYSKHRQERGDLTREQFGTLFKDFFPARNSEHFCDHVFRTFNTSKSGVMSFTEFMIAVHVAAQGTQVEKLRWTFKLYDITGDGVLTKDKVIQMFEAAKDMLDGENNPKCRATELFNKLDMKGSGALTEDQFTANCLHFDS